MRRRGEGGDSFDMLLDTMCNTFGGVCFIALMAAITSALAPDGDEDRLLKEVQMLTNRETARLIRTRDELVKSVAVQKDFLEQSKAGEAEKNARAALARLAASNITAVAELKRQRAGLEDEFAKCTTDVEYSRREAARLKRVLKDMDERLENLAAGKRRVMRTPVERALAGYRPVTVWLRRGVMYELGNEEHLNCAEREENGRMRWTYTPRAGRGIRMGEDFLNSAEFRALAGMVTGKKFLRIFSDGESYRALCEIRDRMIELRKPYNWYVENGAELKFIEGADENVQ